jgi:hypothetical protein
MLEYGNLHLGMCCKSYQSPSSNSYYPWFSLQLLSLIKVSSDGKHKTEPMFNTTLSHFKFLLPSLLSQFRPSNQDVCFIYNWYIIAFLSDIMSMIRTLRNKTFFKHVQAQTSTSFWSRSDFTKNISFIIMLHWIRSKKKNPFHGNRMENGAKRLFERPVLSALIGCSTIGQLWRAA